MLELIICFILTSVSFYLVLSFFMQSNAKLKCYKKFNKAIISNNYKLYNSLIFYKKLTKENVINDYILYQINKPLILDNFKYLDINYSLNISKIFVLKVNNIFDVDFYKKFYKNFYNLNKNYEIEFIFLCKTDFVYEKLIENLIFNIFKVYNIKNISYSLFSVINKLNKNKNFIPLSEIDNKMVNLSNSYNYMVKILNIKKEKLLLNNVLKVNNKICNLNCTNKSYFLEVFNENLVFNDKIFKSFGTNHFISYKSSKKIKYIFNYYLGENIKFLKIKLEKGIKIYFFDYSIKKEILILALRFNKRFSFEIKSAVNKNIIYSYLVLTINLCNEELLINNTTINDSNKDFSEKLSIIKNFFKNEFVSKIGFIDDFYNKYLKNKILKNLVVKEKYYNINYLENICKSNYNFEDSVAIKKIDYNLIKEVINNYNLIYFIYLSKKIDPCLLLYIIKKIYDYLYLTNNQKIQLIC